MAASNKSGSAWGWLGLIVVVALIGSGYLYQREGGRLFGPKEKEAPQPLRETETTPVGHEKPPAPSSGGDKPPLLSLRAGQSATLIVSGTADRQQIGPWLYIDQKLVKDYSGQFDERGKLTARDTFAVAPGNHRVEVVSAGFNPENDGLYSKGAYRRFPFRIEEWKGLLEADQSREVAFPHIPARMVRYSNPNHGFRGYGQMVSSFVTPFTFEKHHLDAYNDHYEKEWKRYQGNEVMLALKKANQQEPKGGVVWVELLVADGGARELNATQIELLADWLNDVHFPPMMVGPCDPDDPRKPARVDDPAWKQYDSALKRGAFDFMERVDRYRRDVENLKAVCTKLRQAPR